MEHRGRRKPVSASPPKSSSPTRTRQIEEASTPRRTREPQRPADEEVHSAPVGAIRPSFLPSRRGLADETIESITRARKRAMKPRHQARACDGGDERVGRSHDEHHVSTQASESRPQPHHRARACDGGDERIGRSHDAPRKHASETQASEASERKPPEATPSSKSMRRRRRAHRQKP